MKYRNLAAAWARDHGTELAARAMSRRAAATFQDATVVKETCSKAEESQRAVLARIDAVARAQEES